MGTMEDTAFDTLADGVARLVAFGYPAQHLCEQLLTIGVAVMSHDQGEAATRAWLATLPAAFEEHLRLRAARKKLS